MYLPLRVIIVAVEMSCYDWLGLGHLLIPCQKDQMIGVREEQFQRDKGLLVLQGGTGMSGRQKRYMSTSYNSSENTHYKMLSKNSRIKIVSKLWLQLQKILNSYLPGVKGKLIHKTRTTTQIQTIWQWFSTRGDFASLHGHLHPGSFGNV